MANKRFWLEILAMTLVFAMTVVGCDNLTDGETEDSKTETDIWSNAATLSQLHGIWKGSYSRTTTLKQDVEGTGTVWTPQMQAFYGDMRVTHRWEITFTVNATDKTEAMSLTAVETCSGGNIANPGVWASISSALSGSPGVTVDNSKYSITIKQNMPPEPPLPGRRCIPYLTPNTESLMTVYGAAGEPCPPLPIQSG